MVLISYCVHTLVVCASVSILQQTHLAFAYVLCARTLVLNAHLPLCIVHDDCSTALQYGGAHMLYDDKTC